MKALYYCLNTGSLYIISDIDKPDYLRIHDSFYIDRHAINLPKDSDVIESEEIDEDESTEDETIYMTIEYIHIPKWYIPYIDINNPKLDQEEQDRFLAFFTRNKLLPKEWKKVNNI